MQAILVLTALDLEARTLARHLDLPALSSLGPRAFGRGSVRIAPVGVGAGRLDGRWTALMAGLDRPIVVSAGVCGALDPALSAGDLVVPARVIAPTGAEASTAAEAYRRVLALAPSSCVDPIVTTRAVIATREAKVSLRARTGAAAADMESSIIVSAAASAGLPSLVVRGVSDDARQALPRELIDLVSPEGGLSLMRAGALLARPAVLPRALGLRRATARALRAVAGVLAGLAG